MTTDKDFLDAILENPADVTRRMVYADWLEERNRPQQAALVRVKIASWQWAKLWPSASLCYVSGGNAWFTTQSLEEQWGDDWNDSPYEHNAGTPYAPCWHRQRSDCWCDVCKQDYLPDGSPRWHIVHIRFGEIDQQEPCDGHPNSPYSIQDINNRKVPWLLPPRYSAPVGDLEPVWAGTPLPEFCAWIEQAGGSWLPVGEEPSGVIYARSLLIYPSAQLPED